LVEPRRSRKAMSNFLMPTGMAAPLGNAGFPTGISA
jgi:hypothetical protein